ncbi:aminotransferase class I/II-fold pyridoxal phosphate-dependent enzyme [Aureibacillus halotolerans]|uniref:Cystathionine beta-lyase family protein involved in aluminum resistance n=1 Tax=Aureibacillus halotolerans TaxID=1508390 RepID=A0A4R6U187_9BACI|nr:methionine gamma-lyase family protein [Aureibacillus halotolerans]TDQ39731.1 cystathionine beta-lyase family protein involved in aluminum resistance [Aureibacillus halotolerans]
MNADLNALARDAEVEIASAWQRIQQVAERNQERVLHAFRRHQVSDAHLQDSTGYGYDDIGRETLEALYADVLGTEDALVRPQIISGTHAIVLALSALLRPGDELLYASGTPYDTLHDFIGIGKDSQSSLKAYGISYKDVPLNEDGLNEEAILASITPQTKVVAIQRSCGYAKRPALSVAAIGRIVEAVKAVKKDVYVFVDNCYGEFTETIEPGHVGADVIAGSLIKNPGGGLARTGGYIAGTKAAIYLSAERLTSPGLAKEVGPSLGQWPLMYQGLFLAPHTVGQALKGAVFTACFLNKLGFSTWPKWNSTRYDLIQTVEFPDASTMIAFCQAIQAASPINSYAKPVPGAMPGYDAEVIMAAGTFVQGASLEFSADGPVKPPYRVYVQGGLTYEHIKIAVKEAAAKAINENTNAMIKKP